MPLPTLARYGIAAVALTALSACHTTSPGAPTAAAPPLVQGASATCTTLATALRNTDTSAVAPIPDQWRTLRVALVSEASGQTKLEVSPSTGGTYVGTLQQSSLITDWSAAGGGSSPIIGGSAMQRTLVLEVPTERFPTRMLAATCDRSLT